MVVLADLLQVLLGVVMGLGDDVAATLNSLDILGDVPAGRIVGTLDEFRRVAKAALEVDAAARVDETPVAVAW